MELHPEYGLCAPEMGWIPSPRYLMRRRRILRWLGEEGQGPLLEIGCGAGALLYDLQVRGFECTALESSGQAREVADKLRGGRERLALYARPQDGWDGAFRTLLACEVLEHIEDDAAALRGWRRYMRPEGRLILSVPADPGRWGEADAWAGHFRRYDRSGLRRLLEQSGFSIRRFETYGYPLANVLEVVRNQRLRRKGISREASVGEARRRDTARSGVERPELQGLYGLYRSRWVSRAVMPFFGRLQELFLETDLGNGHLVMASMGD